MEAKFAKETEVSVEKTRMEIERLLQKYSASGFSYGWQEKMAVLSFDMNKRRVAFFLPLPDPEHRSIVMLRPNEKYSGTRANKEIREARLAQQTRTRWRALLLAIKAKLEIVATGIATFEEEFLPHIVLPNNKTVGSMVVPQIERAYVENKMPPLLGYGP